MNQNKLKQFLHYDKDTGNFTWLKLLHANNVCEGDTAGTTNKRGYVLIQIGGTQHKAHRLAWLYMTGDWPELDIDHKNRVKSDNRWDNLREATTLENSKNQSKAINNTSGKTGVSRLGKKWKVRISNKGKRIELGVYTSKQEAIKIREQAEILYGYVSAYRGEEYGY